ncbi:MAG: glycosyltransferase, partial [Actinomycetes bacterium]
VVVVSHAADRAGSVKVLLELLRRVGPQLDLPLEVQLQAGGPLADELLSFGSPGRPDDVPALVWVNNAAAAGCLWSYPAGTPSLVHVHEEDEALTVLPTDVVDALRHRASRVVCVSVASAAQVVELGVDQSRVHLLPPPVLAPQVEEREVELVRKLTGLGLGGRRVVMACGEATWRKGADLFGEVVSYLAEDPSLDFVWVGRRRPRPFAAALDADVQARGLERRVRWLGEVAEPGSLLALAAVLVVTSREDPRPLVPFEAAYAGTPTVAFDVGGLGVMSAAGAAATVPYPDCRGLAGQVRAVIDDGRRAAGLVEAAVGLARRDHDLDQVSAAFLDLVRSLLGDAPSRAESIAR